MSPYRKRFVQFNMLLIGIVLTVMVAVVAVYMVNDYYNSLRVTMEQVVAPLQGFSQPPKGEPPREKPDQERAEQKKDILTVFYSPESGAYSVLSPNNAFTDEELRSLLSAIVSQEDDFGTLRQSRVIYYRSGGEPCRIAIASTDYITRSMGDLALVLLAIWLSAVLLFFAVSVRLSALAARPMEEAMQREKQFIADASHDLKTPLSVILANNAILLENPEAPVGSVRRWVDSSQEAAKRRWGLLRSGLAGQAYAGRGAFHAAARPCRHRNKGGAGDGIHRLRETRHTGNSAPRGMHPARQSGLLTAHRQQPAGKRPQI